MANDSAVIDIKNLVPVTGNIYAMSARPATTPQGDIYNLSTQATEVTFKLANKMPSTGGWTYSFNNSPFCAYVYGSDPCTETTGVPPALGFAITKITGNNRQFTLAIPQNPGNLDIVYRLFVDRKMGSDAETIIIDPRITNGGTPPSFKILKSYQTLSAGTLVLLALLVLAVGFVMGWVLAGGRRSRTLS